MESIIDHSARIATNAKWLGTPVYASSQKTRDIFKVPGAPLISKLQPSAAVTQKCGQAGGTECGLPTQQEVYPLKDKTAWLARRSLDH